MEVLKYPGSLHSHTDYSNGRLRDAISRVEPLMDRAIELQQKVLAITEHDSVSSAVRANEYYLKLKKEKPDLDFKLILGNEIYLCRNGLNNTNFEKGRDVYYHFILLAKDKKGHEQIREISSRAWGRSYMARGMRRVPTYYNDIQEVIGADPGHVIAMTACLGGLLGTQLLNYRESLDSSIIDRLEIWIKRMSDLFGEGNFFLEMQPSKNIEQIYVNKWIIEFEKRLQVPFTITNDVHYLKKEDKSVHRAFLTAQGGERETEAFYATTYLMDDDEMREYMNIGEENLQKAYKNILFIRDSCVDYSLLNPLYIPYLPLDNSEVDGFLYNKYKKLIKNLETFYESAAISDKHLVREIIRKVEADSQYQNEETYKEIDVCLKSVWDSSKAQNANWSAYLLNVKDYVNIVWTEGDSFVGPSRGSAGGFLLCNILDITQINPLREETPTFNWRFINPERASPLDIDLDIEGFKRDKVMKAFEKVYTPERVAKVLTFRTEKAKSAIQTAGRGLGIEPEITQYLSSMILSPRGMMLTLEQTYYGDEENDIPPNKKFREEMDNNYPELWEVAKSIEGLICGVGSHAGGVIFVDEPFYKTTALMKTSNGDTVIQYDLSTAEKVGLIKIDLLSIEALDKIRATIDLLIEYGYVTKEKTLKETYEKVIGIYNLERKDPALWDLCWNHEVMSLFQMEQQSGIQGISLTKPKSVHELAILNSVIRLMPSEKGDELPLSKYARFKEDISLWYKEMEDFGLSGEDSDWLKEKIGLSYGIVESQEGLMSLVQEPRLGGNSLLFADKLRKSIAKKKPEDFLECEKNFFKVIKEKKLSYKLADYVWNVIFKIQRGYSFDLTRRIKIAEIAGSPLELQ